MTDEKVIELRRRWKEVEGVYGQRAKLAEEFGIGRLRYCPANYRWNHLEAPVVTIQPS